MSRKRTHEDVSSEDEKVFVYYEHTELSSIPKDLTSLRIDKSVRKIPAKAFFQQRSLESVAYEEGLEVVGEKAFFGCSNLREQQFPSTLIEIGKSAFGWCECLESVGRLPLSLRIIRQYAFTSCSKLQSIEIHDGICLERRVFSCCEGLTHVRLPRGTLPAFLLQNCIKLATIELPAGLKKVGEGAFRDTGLQFICFPDEVESIGDMAFYCCESLESVTLPPKLEVIGENLFDNCKKLKDISIPQSVVRIQREAFSNSGLTRLDLSQCHITSIGEGAFADCSNLEEIILPKTNIERIEERTFENCHSLTHLWIPPTVEHIDCGAFACCFSLLSVEVPETLKSLVFVSQAYQWYETDPCGYESLVNICIPSSHQLDDVENYDFMEDLKLGQAEGNYEELVGKLKRRFDSLPVHQVCYFQSYYSREENIRRLRSIATADPGACDKVDFLGMTPFHIVALSHRPRLYLFQELLSLSSLDIMKCRDIFGSTPLDYLCKNHSAAAVSVTKSLLANFMEPRISLLGLDIWRNNVLASMEEVQMAEATALAAKVTSACQKLAKFEWMEVLSLLEMSVWKMKVEWERATGREARESCRISCGSNVVLKNVRLFLESNQDIDDDSGDDDSDDETDEDDSSGDETDDGDY